MKDQQAPIPTLVTGGSCEINVPAPSWDTLQGWIHTRPHRAGLQGQLLSHPYSHIDSVT